MNIREFAKPVTSKSLNESLANRFGSRINLEQFTLEQLQDVRNKLRTKIFNVETNESFDSVQNDTYAKSKLMLDILNAEITERGDIEEETIEESTLAEGAEDSAELVMAAKEMVDRVTGWMEDTAEMQTESMLELADAIRDEMGSEQSEAFTNAVKPALEQMYSVMETTREALTNGVGMLTGEGDTMMGADDDMGDMDMDMEPTDDMDDMDMGVDAVDDEFGAAEAGAGGEEPADRAKRESVERIAKKVKRESVDTRVLAKALSKKK
jgi:hypothetical protein